jgi:hypothetical protein
MQVRIALKEMIGHLIDIYSIYNYHICVADKKRHTLMNWQLASRSQVSSPSFLPISTISTGANYVSFQEGYESESSCMDKGYFTPP